MKKIILGLSFSFLIDCIFVTLPVVSYSQWQQDVRLSYDSSAYPTSRCISSNSPDVHVVWSDWRHGNYQLYYLHSTNNGESWLPEVRMTNNLFNSTNPSISVSGSVVHIVWRDDRDGNSEIYYKRSENAGFNWGLDIRMTNNIAGSMGPSLSIEETMVLLAWEDFRDGNWEIYMKISTNNGLNWSEDKRVTDNPAVTIAPSFDVSGINVHFVWFQLSNGRNRIFYKRSIDLGSTWGPDIQLTQTSDAFNPSIGVSDQLIHVVWHDDRNGTDIYYKRSTNNGNTWEPDIALTNNDNVSAIPVISVSNLTIHVAWQTYLFSEPGNMEIFYKLSSNSGITWDSTLRLTNNTFQSSSPSITYSGSNVHVVWSDMRSGGFDLYYKRNPNGNPIGITPVSSQIPSLFSLSQNYPNPFNPSTKIKFDVPNSPLSFGEGLGVRLIIHDILGREVAVLVNEQLRPGSYEVDWDASAFPSGVYFYTITSGSLKETRKMVLLK